MSLNSDYYYFLDRLKRIFAKENINLLLEDLGVKTSDLMPKGDYNMRVNLTEANSFPFPSFLPLHTFDNTEYDCRNPREWLELGLIDGEQHPVPGKALLPNDDGEIGMEFAWTDVGVLDYDTNKELFLVQIVGTGGLQHNVIPTRNEAKVNGIANGDSVNEEPLTLSSSEAQQSWVPRIQLLFAAECPVNFAERVAKAYALRCETEALLRYNLYIDCMPMDGVVRLDPSSLERMITWARGTRTLRNDKRLVILVFSLVRNSKIFELLSSKSLARSPIDPAYS